jgi:hypothetical protein
MTKSPADDYAARVLAQREQDLAEAGQEIEYLNNKIQEMARELHAAINEPMYAGTRKDWIDRAYAAEAKLDKIKEILT